MCSAHRVLQHTFHTNKERNNLDYENRKENLCPGTGYDAGFLPGPDCKCS